LKARFLRAAQNELREAARYYERQRPGLGAEFREEIRSTIERIKKLPDAWHPLSQNTRRCQTRRFPYGVIYQVRREEILIVAVAHLHQEPERWKGRL
jgi:plasmid stabilization system protein ParE